MAVGNDYSETHYKALLRRGQEPCDFCDRTFKNRFDSIIHNASHIIIPLMKQNWHQCNVCLYYFPSQEDLDDHHETKHPNIAINTQNVNNMCTSKIKFESSDEYDKYNNSMVEKIMKNDHYNINNRYFNVASNINIVKHENDMSHDDIEVNCSRNSLDIKSEAIKEEGFDSDNGSIDITEHDCRARLGSENTESIKSRLRFEEDGLFDDNILSDLITECKVEMFNEPINQMPGFKNLSSENDINNINDSKNGVNITNIPLQSFFSGIVKSNFHKESLQNSNIETNKMYDNNFVMDYFGYDNFVLKNTTKNNAAGLNVNNVRNMESYSIPVAPEPVYESVHYTDLTKPGIFRCKYCFRVFPNRLLLIQHEPVHIIIKRPRPLLCTFCDKYIAGNYRRLHRHITTNHPGVLVDKKHPTHKCTKCSLRFRRYMSHVRNYHQYDCHGCGKEFSEGSVNDLEQHKKKCGVQSVLSKIMNVCGLCYSFFKDTTNVKYILMGTTENEPGVRYPCAVCGKKYFELNMIKRVLYGNSIGGIAHNRSECKTNKARRPLTNEERLKKFQHRLKQINLLNKFYFAVSFCFPGYDNEQSTTSLAQC